MNKSILIEGLDQERLCDLIDQKLKDSLCELKQYLLGDNTIDELLTRQETCKFLKIDQSTLWVWTNKGKVKAYGIGNRRYYKRSELMDALIPLKKKGYE